MTGMLGLGIVRLYALVSAACGLCLMAVWGGGPAAADDAATLDRIKDKAEIRFAYREDAPPFSFVKDGEPAGYSVNLCREVAAALKEELKLPELKVTYLKVTAADRFEAITGGRADLLCEATTATLARREIMDFSIPTYVSGAGLVIGPGGPTSVEALAGRKIGVLGGTTTERDVKALLQEQGIAAEMLVAKTHDEGLGMLKDGTISAYFADRTILEERLRHDPAAASLMLADSYLTIEPYALAMPIDHDFRLAVDRALSRLFRTGGMIKVFRKSVDPEAKPSELLKALSRMSGLPE